jgi:hypothetical protein
MRRTCADIDGDIQSFAFDNATDFSLRALQLIVKAAERSARRDGVVVLDEDVLNTEVCKSGAVVGFDKRAAGVAMD